MTRPTQWKAEYPLRQALSKGSNGQDDETPRPGPSGAKTVRITSAAAEDSTDTRDSKEKKGTVTPRHSQKAMKYGELNLPKIIKRFLKHDLPVSVPTINMRLLSGSLAQSTWRRYGAALRTWKTFACERGKNWKQISENERGNFIGWCKGRGNLNAKTVKIYLGALESLAELKNQLGKGGGKVLEKGLLRGYENLSSHDFSEKKSTTTPVDLKILDNINRGIKKMGWAKGSEISVWTACVVAFWGAFRLAEILPKRENTFDRLSDLLWQDVESFSSEKVVLRIKSAKVPGSPGNRVRLYAVGDKRFCPVIALRSLETLQKNMQIWKKELPIFRRHSGRNLTKPVFLKAVNTILSLEQNNSIVLSGKSFRSGIPSCLENFPKHFQENHVKSLGRWKGQAYQKYMRNDDPEFQWVFLKMSERLLKKFSCHQVKPGRSSEGDSESSAATARTRKRTPPLQRPRKTRLRRKSTLA